MYIHYWMCGYTDSFTTQNIQYLYFHRIWCTNNCYQRKNVNTRINNNYEILHLIIELCFHYMPFSLELNTNWRWCSLHFNFKHKQQWVRTKVVSCTWFWIYNIYSVIFCIDLLPPVFHDWLQDHSFCLPFIYYNCSVL